MKIEEFIEKCKSLNLEITEKKLNQLEIYAKFLQEYNEHTNLTAITNLEDIYLKHFYDSLTLTKVIDLKTCTNLLDFGTGAGFPGMPLRICLPELKVTLLDSLNKRVDFLKHRLNPKRLQDWIFPHHFVQQTHTTYLPEIRPIPASPRHFSH